MKYVERLRRLLPLRYDLHFNRGPYVHNRSRDRRLTARFLLDGSLEYEISLGYKEWGRPYKAYLAPWRVEILDESGNLVERHDFDLTGKSVRVNIDSRSLGDTLAWLPQVARFAAQYPHTKVYCSHFWPSLGMNDKYPELHFIDPDVELENCYATWEIGFYLDERMLQKHPVDPRSAPMAQIASDILAIPYEETRPRLNQGHTDRPLANPYVCIATHSTAGCKLWQYPDGWQRVIDFLASRGFDVVLIQKEPGDYSGIINKTGDLPIQDRIRDLHHCEFFIGLGSGLSWLAWAVNKPVIMINGFSEPFTEFQKDCIRVSNNSVCTGCWNDPTYTFEAGDWNWCPRHRDDGRRFECSTEITPEIVIKAVDRVMAN